MFCSGRVPLSPLGLEFEHSGKVSCTSRPRLSPFCQIIAPPPASLQLANLPWPNFFPWLLDCLTPMPSNKKRKMPPTIPSIRFHPVDGQETVNHTDFIGNGSHVQSVSHTRPFGKPAMKIPVISADIPREVPPEHVPPPRRVIVIPGKTPCNTVKPNDDSRWCLGTWMNYLNARAHLSKASTFDTCTLI